MICVVRHPRLDWTVSIWWKQNHGPLRSGSRSQAASPFAAWSERLLKNIPSEKQLFPHRRNTRKWTPLLQICIVWVRYSSSHVLITSQNQEWDRPVFGRFYDELAAHHRWFSILSPERYDTFRSQLFKAKWLPGGGDSKLNYPGHNIEWLRSSYWHHNSP